MKRLILIGGGGHCKSVINVIEAENKYRISGILDVKEKVGTYILEHPIIGTDADIASLHKEGFHFLVTVGHMKNPNLRITLFEALKLMGAEIATVISPLAWMDDKVKVGEGSILMHHTLVNAGAEIGVNCIINTKALIEHDTIIGDHCHISTAAIINGDCKIGNESFIGSNTVVVNGVNIASGCFIGAGSVVTKTIDTEGKMLVGNPARIICADKK